MSSGEIIMVMVKFTTLQKFGFGKLILCKN